MFPLVQVPPADNYFAALNSAVFTDGSFVYIPKGVNCPMELSTYFRINAEETGQVGIVTLSKKAFHVHFMPSGAIEGLNAPCLQVTVDWGLSTQSCCAAGYPPTCLLACIATLPLDRQHRIAADYEGPFSECP